MAQDPKLLFDMWFFDKFLPANKIDVGKFVRGEDTKFPEDCVFPVDSTCPDWSPERKATKGGFLRVLKSFLRYISGKESI